MNNKNLRERLGFAFPGHGLWRIALASLAALAFASSPALADDAPGEIRHSMSELSSIAKIHLGKTADWVAIVDDAVWVGTTGPSSMRNTQCVGDGRR
jgi:hypothetical protein